MIKKNKGGRPSKIYKFIEAAKQVVYQEDMVYLTDEELVFLINKELDEEDRISDRTFEGWKAGEYGKDEEIGREFLRLIKDALIVQKKELFKKFGKKDEIWTKWAWVIERKFAQWNLKQINETTNTIKTTEGAGIPMINWTNSDEKKG